MSTSSSLSKSRYIAGLQCHRRLWWTVHEPDAPELVPDPARQAIFDQGTRIGELARTYVPGGTLIDLPWNRKREKVEATQAALAAGAPVVYEASFSAGRVFAAVDILERLEDGFGLIEVKSTARVKPEHVPDAAVQVHALEQDGHQVSRVEIMHLNRACTFPDLGDLFTRTPITEQVRNLLPGIPASVDAMLVMLEDELPEVAIGRHCATPYECPFRGRCWAGVPFEPADERQRLALAEDRLVVEPSLREALEPFQPPLAFLDFESVNPAVPAWNGCHPYDLVPVQFSCHRQGPGGYDHVEWLADGPGDPRPGIAATLVAACAGMKRVVVYNASFEKTRLKELGEALGETTARAMADISGRVVDLLPVVRKHVYHPAFDGGFSLKVVLPALVEDLSYEGLEIAGGGPATRALERLLLRGETMDAVERARTREALLRYCEMDTWATVKLLERLRELAGG
jgi:hypothetical protein